MLPRSAAPRQVGQTHLHVHMVNPLILLSRTMPIPSRSYSAFAATSISKDTHLMTLTYRTCFGMEGNAERTPFSPQQPCPERSLR